MIEKIALLTWIVFLLVFVSSIALANFNNTPAQELELAKYFYLINYISYYTCAYYIYQLFVITNILINVIISYAKFEMDIQNEICAF